MSKRLLREFYELKCDGRECKDYLTEGEKKMLKDGKVIFVAKLQEAGTPNGNKRSYPREVLMREIENYQKLVEEKRALGECDHPDGEVISLKNASHMVSRIWWDGNDVLGTIQILSTPAGDVLKGLYQSGVKFGFSSRALGSLQEGKGELAGVQIVQEDLQLICFDAVSEPSAPGAYVMRESQEKNVDKFFTKGDKINRALNEVLRGVK
jgi:hypothetical protein